MTESAREGDILNKRVNLVAKRMLAANTPKSRAASYYAMGPGLYDPDGQNLRARMKPKVMLESARLKSLMLEREIDKPLPEIAHTRISVPSEPIHTRGLAGRLGRLLKTPAGVAAAAAILAGGAYGTSRLVSNKKK